MNSFCKYVSNFAMRSKFSIENNIFNKSFVKKKKRKKEKSMRFYLKSNFSICETSSPLSKKIYTFLKVFPGFWMKFFLSTTIGKKYTCTKKPKKSTSLLVIYLDRVSRSCQDRVNYRVLKLKWKVYFKLYLSVFI